MKKLITTCIILALILAAPGLASADLTMQVAKESELPFSISPQNPINSPSNPNNTINYSGNSASNPVNSSSNPENSPSNTENGMAGNRRLLFEKDGVHHFVGYFVLNENNLLNFFSPYGKRMFFTPSGSAALFGSDDGEFYGALASVNDKVVIVLTEKGQSVFQKEGISPFSPKDTNLRKSITGIYGDEDSDHYLEANYSGGSMIVLEDGSMWEIDKIDQMLSKSWKFRDEITVSSSGGEYDYLLSNNEDGRRVHAKFLGKR